MRIDPYKEPLTQHLNAAVQRLKDVPAPHSEAITQAMSTLEAFQQTYMTSPQSDIDIALQAIRDIADRLAAFAVTKSGQSSRSAIDAAIKELRVVADLLRTAKELKA